jgi:predicted nucleic acid-binding protein
LILVDASVWIDYLNGVVSPTTERLHFALGRDEILIGDLTIAEVLQGIRDEREFERTRASLSRLGSIPIASPQISVQSARNYRRLRTLGITIRKTIDCLIATRCIVDGLPLLYSDRDFDPFVEHLGLQAVE